jgi:hypothetical protein
LIYGQLSGYDRITGPPVLARFNLSKDAELLVLRHENHVLCRLCGAETLFGGQPEFRR